MSNLPDRLSEDIAYLISSWPSLVELRVPGTSPRRTTGHRMSDRQREALARLVRAERDDAREPGAVPGSGPRQVPVAVGILDALARFASTAYDVAEHVAQVVGIDRPEGIGSVWQDPRPHLEVVRTWIASAARVDPETLPWAVDLFHALADSVATLLGEVHGGQVLDAMCPWCSGRGPGGELRTLVVLVPLTRDEQAAKELDATDPDLVEPLIVCRGTNCTPPPSACGAFHRGWPAWGEREWDWLAKQLLPVPQTVAAL
ncbi:hypothetical protein [Oerskovia jenensis]|uniref:hypothetical protein n=1 Tax=Oerskovia jenensis TaxID=162169 RepID=UPI0036DCD2DA